MAALTASLITVNWGIYVWAIAADRAVETALGYYINPLISVVWRGAARREAVAAADRGGRAGDARGADPDRRAGGLPWISLALALSFAIYGYLRKTLPIGPSQGFFLEVLILCVPALALYRLAAGDRRRAFPARRSRPTSACCCSAAR